MGEGRREALRIDFDRWVEAEFHGANVTSDARLIAFRAKSISMLIVWGELSCRDSGKRYLWPDFPKASLPR